MDGKLAEHILMTHRLGEIYKGLENNNVDIKIPDEENFIPEIDKDLIRNMFHMQKITFSPRLSNEAIDILREEYIKTRSSGGDSIPITARQLESTIRLAEAAAKARLSPIVTAEDALLAKSIVDYYLREVSSMNGKVDIDILNSGISSRQRSELEIVLGVIKELKEAKNRAPEVKEVLDELQARGISRERAESDIEKLNSMGEIYRPSDKRIDVLK